jgi:hypothetical protein
MYGTAQPQEEDKQPSLGWQWNYAKPGPYATALDPKSEQSFEQWAKTNKVPWQDTPTADYDMRGYWQAMQGGDPNAKQSLNRNDQRMHFPDTFKTPYHKSFSGESKYAWQGGPQWNEKDQLLDPSGNVLYDERLENMKRPLKVGK